MKIWSIVKKLDSHFWNFVTFVSFFRFFISWTFSPILKLNTSRQWRLRGLSILLLERNFSIFSHAFQVRKIYVCYLGVTFSSSLFCKNGQNQSSRNFSTGYRFETKKTLIKFSEKSKKTFVLISCFFLDLSHSE